LAAAMQTSPVVIGQSDASTPPARYVRLTLKVDVYGVPGNGTIAIDRQTGRYAERIQAGPIAFWQGFDGTRAWRSDPTGMSAVQGNATQRATILAWGYIFAFPRAAHVSDQTVRFDGVSEPVGFTLDPATGLLHRYAIFDGSQRQIVTFSDYRTTESGTIVPRSIAYFDDNGRWDGRIAAVATPPSLPDATFAPPSPPNDATLPGGITSVPFLVANEIVIPVRLDGGPVMHFFLDTGGQNVISSKSLAALGVRAVGNGTVGGAGAGVVPVKYATVRSERIGAVELRDQPFLVLDSSVLGGVDGVVGYELLARFAARIDYRTNTLWLASAVPAAWIADAPANPFVFDATQPQIDGSIDGFPGAMTIDTGNSGVLDINTPFAKQHDLWNFYRASKPKNGSLAGVGGAVATSDVTVRTFELGTAVLSNVSADLTMAAIGVEANSSVAANVGEGVFRNFTFVLDYPHQRLYFAPGGLADASGILFEAVGDRIVVTKTITATAKRAGIRTGMTLTSLDGQTVRARDLASVRTALQGPYGKHVRLVFDATTTATIELIDYL
jgi:hypothetical protein